MTGDRKRIRILHIVHRFGIGGLENGVVNLINTMPEERFQHAIACLTTATRFQQRIRSDAVDIYELQKKPGNDIAMLLRLWRLLRRVKPDVVHTRNIGTLECQVVAFLAGVKCRIHGEHGWDMHDPVGNNGKYRFIRRLCGRFVDCFVPMSRDLERWLTDRVGIPPRKVQQIYNGVDTERFTPKPSADGWDGAYVIGHVGRLEQIKNQLLLLRAFRRLLQSLPTEAARLKLVIVGDGSLMGELTQFVSDNQLTGQVELAGSRDDIADCLRGFRLFALPSVNEGISNTVLEAMSCGLPVVATRVGGNLELVEDGVTGVLVENEDEQALTVALLGYVTDPPRADQHGANARRRIEQQFDLQNMASKYAELYEKLCSSKRCLPVEEGDETCAV